MKDKKDSKFFDEKITEIQASFSDYANGEREIKPHNATLMIIGVYIVIGSLWILFSDRILNLFVQNVDRLTALQTYKGWIFVFITGLIFYIIIYKRIFIYKKSTNEVFKGYEELSSTYEELLAMDEELNQQFEEVEKNRSSLEKSEQRYNLAVEGANDGIWEWDFENSTYYSSLKWGKVFGYDKEEIPRDIGTWKNLLHADDKEKVEKEINKYLNSKEGIYEATFRLRCKNGDYRWILSRGKGIWDHEGNPLKLAGSHTDITDYKALQDKFHESKELYQRIINEAAVVILGVDTDEKLIEFNPFAERLTGYKKSEVVGESWSDLFIPYESKSYTKSVVERVLSGEDIPNQENKIITKEGEIRNILWNNSSFHDSKGNIVGAIAVGTDITVYKAMEKELYDLAYYDQLTGLANRQRFEIILKKKIEIAKEKEKKLALLYLDLDNFKKVNDTYGHSYGDILLTNIASLLRTSIDGDNIARLGGDEFAIIISNVMDTIEFHSKIISIRELINRVWTIEGNEFYITCSMGISIFPDDGMDIQTLLRNADTAMYASKEASKNCHTFYTSEMYDKTIRALSMERDLRNALLNNEFLVYYQPIISYNSGKIIGLEALVRWMHPQKGLVSPLEFIPFAEQTGLIVEIGEQIIIQVCRQLKKWDEMNIRDINVSINLSAIQIKQHDFINRIMSITAENGISSESLSFEITENIAMNDLKQSIKMIESLKDLNIKVALDDFGTGYSSLNYLRKLPVDIIKIDRDFIKNITQSSKEAFIAKSIIEIIHNMNHVVIAEGIETLEQYKMLKDFGCDFAQGYLFSKPLSADEIEPLLSSKKVFDY